MRVLIVGNVLKDVYLNLDTRAGGFEVDKNGVKWLDISFDASEHRFFSRESSLGGAAVSLEVLGKMGISASVTGSDLTLADDGLTSKSPAEAHRYILVSDEQVSYLAPSEYKITTFATPSEAYDYLFVDRSARLDHEAIKKINAYLDVSPNTKLVLYVQNFNDLEFNRLVERANLVFLEGNRDEEAENIDNKKLVLVAENQLKYMDIVENITASRVDISTHLSTYSIAAATVLGSFALGYSVEESLKMARVNVENSRLNAALSLAELKKGVENLEPSGDLELMAANLLVRGKGILAADESGGSIKKKFAQLEIPDTYENRRDYRNIFLSTPDLEQYVNGVILFDETARQTADNGQDFVSFLTGQRVIPGIKVDQGLEKFPDSLETYTKGLEGLSARLKEYYAMGLRFAKWRAAFELKISENGQILTPTEMAIEKNCQILAEYALECQRAGIVPIVEPEVVYDGYYPADKNALVTSKILDKLFEELSAAGVNLKACILKVNMVLSGKQFESQSTPEEVGRLTAEVLKAHVPEDLAGVVFLSGGQTVEQATLNLAEIVKNGPFPWPVTFSFARALQDPALFAWKGDNANAEEARKAFVERLVENCKALEATL